MMSHSEGSDNLWLYTTYSLQGLVIGVGNLFVIFSIGRYEALRSRNTFLVIMALAVADTFNMFVYLAAGYWRQQINYIANHLKNYTQANKDFQVSVSDSKIGQIKSADVHIMPDDNTFTLTVQFDLVSRPEFPRNEVKSRYKQSAQRFSEAGKRMSRRSSWDSIISNVNSRKMNARKNESRSSSRHSSVRSRTSSVRSRAPRLTEETENLLKELQMPDKDTAEVEKLLEDGADSNCKDRNNTPALGVAVRNNFIEAIEPLTEAGARLNDKFGQLKNSALHEAVLLGPSGKKAIQLLLRLGADAQIENKRGENPQMLAIKYGYTELANVLASHISQQLLRKSNLSLPGGL